MPSDYANPGPAPHAGDCGSRVEFDTSASTNTSHLLVGPSEKRRGIIFFPPNAGRVTLSNDTPVVLDNGITLSATTGPLALCLYADGDCVMKPWYAITAAAAQVTGFIQVIKP